MTNDCNNCRHGEALGPNHPYCGPCEFHPEAHDGTRPQPTRWEPRVTPVNTALALQEDRKRLEWVMPIFEDAHGRRAGCVAAALLIGKRGRDAIDYAMEGCPE